MGDYILSPELCVERKSLPDLRQSFMSGRLYNQAEAMSKHYKTPILLIEFDRDRAFALQTSAELGSDINVSQPPDLTPCIRVHCQRKAMHKIVHPAQCVRCSSLLAVEVVLLATNLIRRKVHMFSQPFLIHVIFRSAAAACLR